MPFKVEPPLYSTWSGMISRCYHASCKAYKDYGARGIIVCERWRIKGQGFRNFVEDMGERPEGHSLDRIDNDGNYEPSNCKWSTRKEQQRNQRCTRKITIEGVTYIARELAEKYGFKADTLMERAKVCKTFEELVDKKKRVFKGIGKKAGLASGAKKRAMTHCKNGHEFTEENTYRPKEGWRSCRKCHAIRQQKINQAKRKNK